MRAWDGANAGPSRPGSLWKDVPLHWHVRVVDDPRYDKPFGSWHMAGDGLTPPVQYWRKFGCPPACPDPPKQPDFSIGMRPGHETRAPEFPPEHRYLISADAWHSVADPADYGEKPSRRRQRGVLVRLADHGRHP